MKNLQSLLGICSFLLIVGTQYSFSQPVAVTAGEITKVGLSGGQFLKIGVGARAAGMAGAYSGIADDLSAIFWNPAGVADIEGYASEVSHTFWFAGMSHSFAAASMPVGEKLRLAASFTSFSSGDIQITNTLDPDGATTGTYNVADIAIGLTLAGYLTEKFSFGATAKFISHAFSTASAGGVAFDVSSRYKTGFNGIDLGFGISSLGGQMAYDGAAFGRNVASSPGLGQGLSDTRLETSPFNLPLSFRAGLGIDMFRGIVEDAPEVDLEGIAKHGWIVGADFETFADVPEQVAIGTEYTYREFVSLRAGYRFGSDQFGISGGFGFRYLSGDFDGRLDYSISPTTNIGLVNRLSVMLNFK
jgi:hypothetical protein